MDFGLSEIIKKYIHIFFHLFFAVISPIQVVTRPNPAHLLRSDEIRHSGWYGHSHFAITSNNQ